VHSAQVKQNIQLYRELNSDVTKGNQENATDKLKNGAQVHDTKTPIILSQKARAMREHQEREESKGNH